MISVNQKLVARSPVVNGLKFPEMLDRYREIHKSLLSEYPLKYFCLTQVGLTSIAEENPLKKRYRIEIHEVPEADVPRDVVRSRHALKAFRRLTRTKHANRN